MRVRFVGTNGDRLEIIEVTPSRFQFVYFSDEERGISRVNHGPLEELARQAVKLGWIRLPDDPVEKQSDRTERQRKAWLASINPNFTPSPKPKPKVRKPRLDEFMEIPLP